MIETVESREEFEKRRQKAQAAMKEALGGKFEKKAVALVEKARLDGAMAYERQHRGLPGSENECPRCAERKRKSAERVKRYRARHA